MSDHTTSIGNPQITLTLRTAIGEPMRLQSLTAGESTPWQGTDLPVIGLSLESLGDISAALVVSGTDTRTEGDSQHLAVHLTGPHGITATAWFEATSTHAIIRTWLDLHSDEAQVITRAEPFRLTLANPVPATLHTVSGVQQQGGWRPDHGDYRSFRLESATLDAATTVVKQSGPRSTWDETPWATLSHPDTTTKAIIALEYGGQWELAATSATVAIAPVGILPEVTSGTTWTSPAIWIGAASGDLDDVAAVMHHFLRETVLPATDADFPWVQYNTWFSYYCELDHDTLLQEADRAAAIGTEVFYVDAGWWVGNPLRRDRFSSGLGNWTENREKFPQGLKAFADDIRARGMHFGLWVEPERVDIRTATTGTWQEEWIARESDNRYIRCDWPSDTETAWLCFGNAAVQDWATEWISALVEECGIRWLKWDSNYWGICTSPNHDHPVGDAEAHQIEGVQIVLARLNERFPDLVIENCAGGATRMDFALARHTPAAWLNDASEPAHRSRFHNAGASYLFPPEMLNAWITESEHENVNTQDLPDEVWRMVIRSRMLGAIGFSCRLTTWSDHTLDVAREEVMRYREALRPHLRHGSFRHLLPQPVIDSARLPTPETWEAYQISAADRSEHIILGFRNMTTAKTQVVHPHLIDPAATYTVLTDTAAPDQRTGESLLREGLTLTCPLLTSTWITIRRTSAGDAA